MATVRRPAPNLDPALLDTRPEAWLTGPERQRLAALAGDYRTVIAEDHAGSARAYELSRQIDRECHPLARYRIVGGQSVAAAERAWSLWRRIEAQRAAGWIVRSDGTIDDPVEANARPTPHRGQ